MNVKAFLTVAIAVCLIGGCHWEKSASTSNSPSVLRVAVTTSTRDSGLLDEIHPAFEQQQNVRIDVIAVGTGAALKLGEAGDVDVVLVHAREAEDAFMAAGHGVRREDVMFNTFEILGPADDPAGIKDMEPSPALVKIAQSDSKFVSRGDQSGTHKRELKLWETAGGLKPWDGYLESGQGMGATLNMADQLQAYVLCDRGTYLKFKAKIELVPLVDSHESLRNPYGAIAVDPSKHTGIKHELANAYLDFLNSPETQQRIADYKVEGEPLFTPLQLAPRTE